MAVGIRDIQSENELKNGEKASWRSCSSSLHGRANCCSKLSGRNKKGEKHRDVHMNRVLPGKALHAGMDFILEGMTMAIETAALGAAIKQVRLIRRMTQVELAKAAGLSKGGNSVALIEQGRRSVSMETLNAIALGLEIPP